MLRKTTEHKYMRTDAQKKSRKSNVKTGAPATKNPDKTI